MNRTIYKKGKWRSLRRPTIPTEVERVADDLRDSGADWVRLEADGRDWIVCRLDHELLGSWEIVIAEVTS